MRAKAIRFHPRGRTAFHVTKRGGQPLADVGISETLARLLPPNMDASTQMRPLLASLAALS